MKQAVQRSGGVSISRVTQNLPGCHPVQPALAEPALAGDSISRSPFQTHTIL